MSKSLGNVIAPQELEEKFGVDGTRYLLLKLLNFSEDSDFSWDKAIACYNADLANGLGNLLQRTLVMIDKYKVEVSPTTKKIVYGDASIIPQKLIDKHIELLEFQGAFKHIQYAVTKCNHIIDDNKPWELAKKDQEKLQKVLQFVYEHLFRIADALEPFMPESSQKIKDQLNTLVPKPLFPKVEK